MKHARRALLAAAALLAFAGSWEVAAAGWIHAKAYVAQRLIAAAWSSGRDGARTRAPWPGADLRPIARLSVEARHVELYVLDNVSPRTLAFGPALVPGTAAPASAGNAVIVAHRDTHFAFLQHLATNDVIEVEGLHGARARYRVREAGVVDRHETRVLDSADSAQLTMITCYPFDAVLPGTPWRYVVIADRVSA